MKGLLLAVSLVAALIAEGVAARDAAVARAFQKSHPCPSTGKTSGSCPGYRKDHIKPLCAGGPDHPSNMQWQTVAEAKKKDQLEREQCKVRR